MDDDNWNSALEAIRAEQRSTNVLLYNIQQLLYMQLSDVQQRQFAEFQVDELQRFKKGLV